MENSQGRDALRPYILHFQFHLTFPNKSFFSIEQAFSILFPIFVRQHKK